MLAQTDLPSCSARIHCVAENKWGSVRLLTRISNVVSRKWIYHYHDFRFLNEESSFKIFRDELRDLAQLVRILDKIWQDLPSSSNKRLFLTAHANESLESEVGDARILPYSPLTTQAPIRYGFRTENWTQVLKSRDLALKFFKGASLMRFFYFWPWK